MWVEVVEQNSSAAAGSAVTAEFYARGAGSGTTGVNLNTIAPLQSLWDGPGSTTLGQPILPDVGAIPQITITNPNSSTVTISGVGGGSFVLTQFYAFSGTDQASSAAITGAFVTSALTNVTVNVNQSSAGAGSVPACFIFAWTVGTGPSWSLTLQYISAAGCGYGQNSKWRRTWLAKLAGFTQRPPEKESRTKGEDEKLRLSILDEVKTLMNGKSEFRREPMLDWRDEKEKGYAFVEEPMRPPPLRVIRTPGRQGGPNAEDVKVPVRPPTPIAAVRQMIEAAEAHSATMCQSVVSRPSRFAKWFMEHFAASDYDPGPDWDRQPSEWVELFGRTWARNNLTKYIRKEGEKPEDVLFNIERELMWDRFAE